MCAKSIASEVHRLCMEYTIYNLHMLLCKAAETAAKLSLEKQIMKYAVCILYVHSALFMWQYVRWLYTCRWTYTHTCLCINCVRACIPIPGWLLVLYAERHPAFAAVAAGVSPSSQVAAIATQCMLQMKNQPMGTCSRDALTCQNRRDYLVFTE